MNSKYGTEILFVLQRLLLFSLQFQRFSASNLAWFISTEFDCIVKLRRWSKVNTLKHHKYNHTVKSLLLLINRLSGKQSKPLNYLSPKSIWVTNKCSFILIFCQVYFSMDTCTHWLKCFYWEFYITVMYRVSWKESPIPKGMIRDTFRRKNIGLKCFWGIVVCLCVLLCFR